MNQKEYFKLFSKSPGNQSYRCFWRYFGENLSSDFITWEMIWGLVAVKFVGNLYLEIYVGILLLGKLFGD